MPFIRNDLVPMHNSSRGMGVTGYTYVTGDDAEAVGYFNDVAELLDVGDQIHTTLTDGGDPFVPTAFAVYIVTDITDGVVTVSDFVV